MQTAHTSAGSLGDAERRFRRGVVRWMILGVPFGMLLGVLVVLAGLGWTVGEFGAAGVIVAGAYPGFFAGVFFGGTAGIALHMHLLRDAATTPEKTRTTEVLPLPAPRTLRRSA